MAPAFVKISLFDFVMRNKYVAPSCAILISLRPSVRRLSGTTPFCVPSAVWLLPVRSTLTRRTTVDATSEHETEPARTESVLRDRVMPVSRGAAAAIVSGVTGMTWCDVLGVTW